MQYLIWLANIVPIKKTNGQIRAHIDVLDLRKACLKDDFSVSHMELLIEATTGYDALSFMDGYSEYNQIKTNPDNIKNGISVT